MSFLSSVVGYVVTALLSALSGWIMKYFQAIQKEKREVAKDTEETAAARAALEAARTKQELDNAAKKLAENFNK